MKRLLVVLGRFQIQAEDTQLSDPAHVGSLDVLCVVTHVAVSLLGLVVLMADVARGPGAAIEFIVKRVFRFGFIL